MNPTENRIDFIYLFDVKNGNPNGDPDAGNAPRIDPETGHGLVSDVCLKRKIRNFITLTQMEPDGSPSDGYDIYVKEKAILNQQHDRAYEAKGLNKKEKDAKKAAANQDAAREWMCQTFFDVRMFGAVMSTGTNCGQVRGPVQLTFANSVDPINHLSQSITRMAVTTEKESASQSGGNRTMGNKELIPYGLYVAHGFVNPALAAQTGFSQKDLELLWQSLDQMFEHDRSAARGLMGPVSLFVFEHESKLGNARAAQLFSHLKVELKDGKEVARSAADYDISFDEGELPTGVKLHRKI